MIGRQLRTVTQFVTPSILLLGWAVMPTCSNKPMLNTASVLPSGAMSLLILLVSALSGLARYEECQRAIEHFVPRSPILYDRSLCLQLDACTTIDL